MSGYDADDPFDALDNGGAAGWVRPERGLSAVVFSAGAEDRMQSERPKPLHIMCGKPMVGYVLDALGDLPDKRIVLVVDAAADQVAKRLARSTADPRVVMAEYRLMGGTGDAVHAGLRPFGDDVDDDDVLVLRAEMPLVRPATIAALVDAHRNADVAATMLTADVASMPDAHRVVTGKGDLPARLVAADAIDGRNAQHASTGIFCFRRSLLAPALRRVAPDSTHGRCALEDVIEVLTETGNQVARIDIDDVGEVRTVDDRIELADAEAQLRERINRRWMADGVAMVDPARTYIDTTVSLARDVTLFPGTMLQGATVVGAGAEIGPDTRLVDCAVGAGARVEKTMARDAEIGADAIVGPFAVLEPGAHVASARSTGPFYHAAEPALDQ